MTVNDRDWRERRTRRLKVNLIVAILSLLTGAGGSVALDIIPDDDVYECVDD